MGEPRAAPGDQLVLGGALAGLQLDEDVRKARQLRKEEQALAGAGARARVMLGQLWKEGEADWGALEAASEWSGRFNALVQRAEREKPVV